MNTKNIEQVLAQADATDLREGKGAYMLYNRTLRDLAAYHGVGFCQTVAAFAALSPNNDYWGNLRSTASVIVGAKAGKGPEEITISTYKACGARAWSFFTGETDFLMETRGPKTRAFYYNLIKPDCPKHITIDGHMYGIWLGERLTMVEAVRAMRGNPYEKVAETFKKVARRHELLPNQLQAILWFTWKRIHNVVYSAQLELLGDAQDRWKIYRSPETILPY